MPVTEIDFLSVGCSGLRAADWTGRFFIVGHCVNLLFRATFGSFVVPSHPVSIATFFRAELPPLPVILAPGSGEAFLAVGIRANHSDSPPWIAFMPTVWLMP